MDTSYTPVGWVYREQVDEAIANGTTGKIFFFSEGQVISELCGKIIDMQEVPGEGLFLYTGTSERVRVDRIITLFGKPAAAFDEYDAYANACMDCMGGYDQQDLDKM